jgi:hypothetical protein
MQKSFGLNLFFGGGQMFVSLAARSAFIFSPQKVIYYKTKIKTMAHTIYRGI